MKQRALTTLSLCLLLGAGASAQEQGQETSLRRASRTFAATDRNHDGALDASETAKASMPRAVLKSWDRDENGTLSKEEFLYYYRQLMINAGLEPGEELDREARRITALWKSRDAREARRRAREEELKKLKDRRERETAEEKYRRAQAKLDAPRTTPERGSAVGGESAPPGDSPGAEAGSATPDRIDRARSALDRTSGPSGAKEGPNERSYAAEAFISALDDLERRARGRAWSRQRYEAELAALIRRARAVGTGQKTEAEHEAAVQALKRALIDLEDRSHEEQWSRIQYEKERRKLIKRARPSRTEGSSPPGGGGDSSPPDQDYVVAAFVRALDALERRAKGRGWGQERYEQELFALIRRARSAHAKGQDEEQQNAAAEALTRSLLELAEKARAEGWTRKRFEAKRLELVRRAHLDGKGSGVGTRGADKSGKGTSDPGGRQGGSQTGRTGPVVVPVKVERTGEVEKAGGEDSSAAKGDAKKNGSSDADGGEGEKPKRRAGDDG